VAKSLLDSIPQEKRPVPAWLDRASRDPAQYLAAGAVNWNVRAQREVGFFALSRLARIDSVVAARVLEPVLPLLGEADQQYAWGLLALEAARRHEPQALPWFQNTGGVGLSEFQREWWARAALRGGDWRAVLWAISGMGEDNRNQPGWQYWQGRALKALGQVLGANRIFAPLSREPHYYGLLAGEELGAVMGTQTINIKVSGEEVGAVARDAGIARALALYQLELRTEAANEWIWAVRNFSDRQLLAAAELARSRDWHDRAINTAEKTRELHDFDLRFISPYRELASKEAKENKLDEAWVYGLIRQESRFVNVARSSVGAAGLMQIMPATGRWVAQRLGIKGFNTRSLNEPETNIKFGTYYLRHVQESLDGHPVLATAAYNAGPRRAQRWRDNKPMEGAIYIESIPFTETRDYVKKVMSNAMYYALRFGQPSILLADRLGTIPGRAMPAPPADASDTQPSLESSEGES
jgi:soluble lytic murein transglycosylase